MTAHLSLVLSQTSNCSPDIICRSVTAAGSETVWATGVALVKSYKVTEFLQRKSTNQIYQQTLEKMFSAYPPSWKIAKRSSVDAPPHKR